MQGTADIESTESKMHQQAVIWAVHQFFVLPRLPGAAHVPIKRMFVVTRVMQQPS